MKILIAPDSYKGSLTASEVCSIIAEAAFSVHPDASVAKLPMADGGEGTVECIIDGVSGKRVSAEVAGPLKFPDLSIRIGYAISEITPYKTVTAHYGILDGNTAIMEMSQASGFQLVNKNQRNIMRSNTFGTGQMILDAVARGCKTIYIGIGGSATNDGGMGFASALGIRFLGADGKELEPVPANFRLIEKVDGLDTASEKLKGVSIIVMSDVTNPLLGPSGCAHIFAAQKGASMRNIEMLEDGMHHYKDIVAENTGADFSKTPGAGAAGGLGFGLLSFAKAELRSGIDTILDIVDFNERIKNVDFVITGEGRMDAQSAYGKVASGVARSCRDAGVPCIAIVGDTGNGFEKMYDLGLSRIIALRKGSMSAEYSISHAKELLRDTALEIFKTI